MPPFRPVHRSELVEALRLAGFEGPYTARRHQVVIRGQRRVWIPNPHSGDIGMELLTRVLRQAGLTRDEWERL